MLIRNQKGAGIVDTLLVCILFSFLIGALFPYYRRVVTEAKEVTLRTGLDQIRKGIEVYHLLQGRYPADLRELAAARYLIPVREDTFFSGGYLRAQALDRHGNLLDPFGNRYRYDSKSGAVGSETKGYEAW